jgi:hypothetical protein
MMPNALPKRYQVRYWRDAWAVYDVSRGFGRANSLAAIKLPSGDYLKDPGLFESGFYLHREAVYRVQILNALEEGGFR